ncbi:uncharacterized protein LOC122871790 isoform X1 [Siniperca chuatsi]|uniref:uncharacterized protein LOC122871790 isoform X1 n=1 Tax=Siniperca chuatsi TaxID=119488 RepID=UPI001CE0351D|nr:uncharacterized protein LOC122871790 isoform X1 [Siniperca chuatsi]
MGEREPTDWRKSFQASIGSQVCHLSDQLQQLMARLETLITSPPAPAHNPAPVPAPHLAPAPMPAPVRYLSRPERFSMDSGNCRSFLVRCGLHFKLQVSSFQTERAKVAYIIIHLNGRAEAWATAEWARNSRWNSSTTHFARCSKTQHLAETQLEASSWVYARASVSSPTIPSSSVPWQLTAAGTLLPCLMLSTMGWQTPSRTSLPL